MKLLQKNKYLILILVLGLFLRSFKPLTFFQYSHDQDLAGWFLRDVLFNHHLRLIGQETSSHGIFIGPFFYYLQIPFYLLTRLDPSGTLLLPIILGVFAIFSVYFVLKEIFDIKIGYIGALLYAASVLIIFTDREVAPTMPVMLWSVWFLYCLNRILKGQKYAYTILGLLIGLIWSINLQLVILMPLVVIAQIISKKKINFIDLFTGVAIAALLNIPFLAFELRHGFQQIKALLASLTTNKDYVTGTSVGFAAKLDRTMQLVYKNTTNFFWSTVINVPFQIDFWLFNLALIFFALTKKIRADLTVLLLIWQIIYILFFSKISLNISEYYLNGMNIVYILIVAVTISYLISSKKYKKVGILVMATFLVLNLYSFFTRPVNAEGYIQRKEVIAYIKDDAAKHGYPCVSLSFITSPGNNLGYRYFTWELKLKTKPISNSVPVYSIVFPLSKVDGFSKSFGALGVVNPDYKRYNLKTIESACSGSDYTTEEPMFGFTN